MRYHVELSEWPNSKKQKTPNTGEATGTQFH